MSEFDELPVGTVAINSSADVGSTAEGEVQKVSKKMKNGTAKKVETWGVADRTTKSAAIRSLRIQTKDGRIPGVCLVKSCKARAAGRSQWCSGHKSEIRKEQLRLNNIVWRRRMQAGTAKHHVVYRGKLTAWAAEHKDDALKLVKKGRSVVDRYGFLSAYAKVKAAAQSKAARRRG